MKKIITYSAIAVFALIILTSGCGGYNGMVDREEQVSSAWGQVENVYQRRLDLIPNMVKTVENYANFEKSALTDVINARAQATQVKIDPSKLTPESIQSFQSAQDGLSQTLSRLMVVVEKYPDLKANEQFTALQAELAGTENRISIERRNFTKVTEEYNKYIRKFPKNIWAGFFSFQSKAYFKSDAGAEHAPKVEMNIK